MLLRDGKMDYQRKLRTFRPIRTACDAKTSMRYATGTIGVGLCFGLIACAGAGDDEPGSGTGGGTGGSAELDGGGGSGGEDVAGAGSGGEDSAGSGGDVNVSGGGGGIDGAIGGTGGSDTSSGSGGFVGGPDDLPPVPPLDCGENGVVVENAGPPENRVNYVIVGDGYSEEELATGALLDQHIAAANEKRFSNPIGEVYLRYRKFVNMCVIKLPSTPICGSSRFGCCGSDSSRLASCDSGSVNNALSEELPPTFEVDWRAVVLNGSSWWNTGSQLMLWSGGHNDAAGAALHEGGHGFHQLADEYCGSPCSRQGAENSCSGSGQEYNEVNSTGDCTTTDGKWDLWLGFNQEGATGMQGTFIGSRYVDSGQFRPSANSMMNSLFGDNVDTSFNSVSREKMIMDIWRIVERPWDSVSPPAGAITNPPSLMVHVIDPEVISVDWSVDGNVIAEDGGPSYDVGAANLAAGSYTITARAYDNAGEDLVRYREHMDYNRQYWGAPSETRPMAHSDQTVTWTVTIQ